MTETEPLLLYNTLKREKQPFVPQDPGRVTLYVCGPTVYSYAHIGNARPAVVFDLLYRLLSTRYPKVVYARNITDVDDKILAAASTEISPLFLEFAFNHSSSLDFPLKTSRVLAGLPFHES